MERITDGETFHGLSKVIDECRTYGMVHNNPTIRRTTLSRAPKSSLSNLVRRVFEIRIWPDNRSIIAAQFRLQRNSTPATDDLRCKSRRRRTGQRYRINVVIIHQRFSGCTVPLNNAY